MSDNAVMPVASAENVRGPFGVWRKAYKPKKVKDPSEEPIFQRIADKVSYGMGTPLNIFIWVVLVIGWTLLFALSSSESIRGGKFFRRGSPARDTTSRSTWSPPWPSCTSVSWSGRPRTVPSVT